MESFSVKVPEGAQGGAITLTIADVPVNVSGQFTVLQHATAVSYTHLYVVVCGMNFPKSVKYRLGIKHINFNNLIVLWKLNPNSYVVEELHWLLPCCWVVHPVYCSMRMIL